MGKFRKKPVVIEAWQFDGTERHAHWFLDKFPDRTLSALVPTDSIDDRQKEVMLVIPTLEGNHNASPGDWIIQGVKGELYPCKPDIFEMTYEPVHQDLTGTTEG